MLAWFVSQCTKTVFKQEFLPIQRTRHRKWIHRFLSVQVRLNSSGINCAEYTPLTKNCPEYIPLLSSIEDKRSEAQRSVLVQVKDHQSAEDLYQYCTNKYGHVKGLHFYKNTSSKTFTNFFIVEFAHSDSVNNVLRLSQHTHDNINKQGGSPVPVYSPFLWLSGSKNSSPRTLSPCYIPVHTNEPQTGDVLVDRIAAIQDVSEQMEQLWQAEAMTDASSRIRFLVCRQIELAISGMFPFSSVVPFGSSVNSHGHNCCDLDMELILDGKATEDNDNRLIFHAKGAVYGAERAQVQRYCDEISKIIQSFLPGCQDVQRVLNARVPIIKYSQQLVGLECDLKMSSDSGIHMSCLLHLWGHADWRVRPLVAMVRKWAKAQSLVLNVRPTQYFTNFTLTMLVIFYLQAEHRMLPTVGQLFSLATPIDRYTTEDGLQMDFLHDINNMKHQLNACYDSPVLLEDLLRGFYQFYAKFDFTSSTLCTISGKTITKRISWRNSSAMDITNPLEPDLNVSYNLNKSAVNLFKEKCADGVQKLEKLRKTKEAIGVLQKDGLLWLMSKEPIPRGKKHIKVIDLCLLDTIETQKTLSKNETIIEMKKNISKKVILDTAAYLNIETDVVDDTLNKKSIKIRELFKPKSKNNSRTKSTGKLKKNSGGNHLDANVSDFERLMSEDERIEYLKQRYLRLPNRSNPAFIPKI